MHNLKRDIISRRSNQMELQVFAIISNNLDAYSLETFCRNFESDCKALKHISTAQADKSYKALLVGDLVEVWHQVDKPRLICLVTKNNV